MTDIETRVREAMRAEAGQARPEKLRPLRALPDTTVRRWAAVRGAGHGWLVPAAAAMAIVVVIALVSLGVRAATSRQGELPGNNPSAPAGQEPTVGAQVAAPTYFVALATGVGGHRAGETPATAVVHSAATGTVLSSMSLPHLSFGGGDALITAAGDDRHFVVELPTGPAQHPVNRFWWLTVGTGGRHVRLTPLTLPAGPSGLTVTGLAVTANGSKLAIAWGVPLWTTRADGITSEIWVVTLASGATQTWSTRQGNIPHAVGTITDVSWGTGDRLLGFQWAANFSAHYEAGYYLLDTDRPRAGLLAQKILPGLSHNRLIDFSALGGQAQTVIASVQTAPAGKQPMAQGNPAILEFSVRTGQVLRTLYGPGSESSHEYPLDAVDPSGQHVLTSTPQVVRIDNGVATALITPNDVDFTAAW